MGLAATSGEPVAEYLFYVGGIACIIIARKLLRTKSLSK
jgi:hypothetical protein